MSLSLPAKVFDLIAERHPKSLRAIWWLELKAMSQVRGLLAFPDALTGIRSYIGHFYIPPELGFESWKRKRKEAQKHGRTKVRAD